MDDKLTILIIGNGGHGKDEAAKIIQDEFGLTFMSSSWAAAEQVVFPKLRDFYSSVEACYEDRRNHRQVWYDLITEYNKDDRTKLARAILETSNIYVGMRNRDELLACKEAGVFDYILWIDAENRLPPENDTSITVTADDAFIIIDNNGDLDNLRCEIEEAMEFIFAIEFAKSKPSVWEEIENELRQMEDLIKKADDITRNTPMPILTPTILDNHSTPIVPNLDSIVDETEFELSLIHI